VARVKGLGCAERTASQREWAPQKAERLDFQILSFTSAMKMIESPAACQGAMVAESLQKKAIAMRAGGVTDGFQVMAVLGEDSLGAGFLGFVGAVSTNETDTVASVALQAEPGPVA